jgi:hypothetical protein
MSLVCHPMPPGFSASPDFQVWVNDQPVDVFVNNVAAMATWSTSSPVRIRVRSAADLTQVWLQPARRAPASHMDGSDLVIDLESPRPLSLTCAGRPPLYLFASPTETDIPDRNDPLVTWVATGQELRCDQVNIPSGGTLYLEGGSVVRGTVRALNGKNIRLCGRGVVDGSQQTRAVRQIVIEHCSDVVIEGIISLNPSAWNLVIGGCERVLIDGVKEIGTVVCSDGIDIVGSHHVRVCNAFVRANDDCVVIKSVSYHDRNADSRADWRGDVADVVVERCVFYNDVAGNVMEIGFETQCDRISGIVFRDIDVLGAHGQGGVFTIHNGDRAVIEDVLYQDIHIEHYYDQLIDFRTMPSRYSRDNERGYIRNIRFEHIRGIADLYNTVSLFGGYDDEHLVSDIRLHDVQLGGKCILSLNDLHGFTRCAEGISFT